ncbi:MAG: helix-turn-helix domain-containing protein [Acidimicrobiales bacterium]
MGETPRGLLYRALQRSGMNARQLAKATGISEGRISDYLSGRHIPGGAQLLRLLSATGYRLELVPDSDGNGIILAELLDLVDAIEVGAPSWRERPLPPPFAELLRD